MSTKNKIRIGIVGVGNWGRYGHIPSIQLLPDFEIVAVSSRRLENAKEIAKEFGISHVFSDAKALIHHPEIDLVVVLPPAPHHAHLVREAITAGKDVYCEWPLTTTVADTEDLLARAKAAKIRHVVGLQRRMGPSARYVRDLLAQGYVGAIRSVRMHVSMNSFQSVRSKDLEWTIPAENFSHVLSIYGGHFMDMLFHVVGAPSTVSGEVANQFANITIAETGKTLPTTTPDQVLVIGSLPDGGVFTIQIEGGKRNNSGLQIDITGTKGDLRISNGLSFQNPKDNLVEGSQANGESLHPLPIPPNYSSLPASTLDASVLDLAHLYAAYAKGHEDKTYRAPNFADALWMHRLIDLISKASVKGQRQTVTQNYNH
jgi:predicted dehydrogenase